MLRVKYRLQKGVPAIKLQSILLCQSNKEGNRNIGTKDIQTVFYFGRAVIRETHRCAEPGDAAYHLPPSPTPISQLDGVAEPDPVREQDPEPVPQPWRRWYCSGKLMNLQLDQIDIDHLTLCVKCDTQVYIDKDCIYRFKCLDNISVDPLMFRSKKKISFLYFLIITFENY